MAVPVILATLGKIALHPATSVTLLGANTVMSSVHIKQGEDIKSGISSLKSGQEEELKLLKQISVRQQLSLTSDDLDDYFSQICETESTPPTQYSTESLDAAYNRGVAEAQAQAAANKAAADKAAAEAAQAKELADLRAQVAALKAASATPAAETPTTPTTPAPAQDQNAAPAWLGQFAKMMGDEMKKAVQEGLATPAPVPEATPASAPKA